MKKIYFILSLAVIALLSSCSEDYNEHNFPGYTDAATPTNVVSYTYTMTDADYTTIATAIKKPVNDSITLLKTQLKTASKTDSVTLNLSIARLNTKLTSDSTYIKATYIANNKLFNSKLKAADYIPYLLNSLYKYTDKGSACKVTYNNADNGDTTVIAAANRFTLSDADYLSMGTGTNQPGQYKNLSSVMSVMTYLNQYLKIKCPYAQTNDVRVVSYLYYDYSKVSKKQYRILTFDGQNWVNGTGQYVNNGTNWMFDPTIYVTMKKGINATDDYMLVVNNTKANQGVATPSLLGYYNGTLEYEYYYGFLAYYGEISWKESDRKNDPEYVALTTVDQKVDFLTKRTQEGLAVYLGLKYPDAQPQVNGIDLYCYVTTTLYYEFTATTTTTSTTNYKYKYQRVDNGTLKWKYISREKL